MKKVTLLMLVLVMGCGRLDEVGRAPDFAPLEGSYQHHALYSSPFPDESSAPTADARSSLWSGSRGSLFGDRRAARRGDILTVVIKIDDRAEMSDNSGRSRSSSQNAEISSLLGPTGGGLAAPLGASSGSTFKGSGTISRNESLELRMAATVVEELPNGVLRIEGQQEVRVNHELRELIVTGYVRPSDISRLNEITYDKIAGARVSYGGRGMVSDVQQPSYGQQIMDKVLPF